MAKLDIETTTGRKGILDVWQVDLMSFESVKEFCARAGKLDRLDAVVKNAGLATPFFEMVEGMESTITVNVISTFLMAFLMLPHLRASASKHNILPRLTVVASDAHEQVCAAHCAFRRQANIYRQTSEKQLLHPSSKPSNPRSTNQTDTTSPSSWRSSQLDS